MELSTTLVLFCALLAVPTEAKWLAQNARGTHSERTSSVAERYMKKLYEEQAEDAPIIMCFADTGELRLVIFFKV